MNWWPIFVTAFLSSLLTLGGVGLAVRLWLAPKLQRELDQAREKFGQEVEQRVKRGIRDGVASLPSTDLLKQTQRTVTRSAGDLVKEGLGAMLGTRGKRDSRD